MKTLCIGLALASLSLVAACSNDSGVTARSTQTVSDSIDAAADTTSESPGSTVSRPPSTEAPTSAATVPSGVALMPDVVCMNLQDAQDFIQTQGVFFSRSEDATGRGRRQILDRNWQVVRQEPAVGTPIDEGDALLYVVKYGEEPNPCS